MSNTKSFYQNFEYSMNSLGLPAPKTLFGTFSTATANISVLVAAYNITGASVTIGELVLAGTLSEVLVGVAALGAAFYIGACIGALIYAAQRELFAKDQSATSLIRKASQYGIIVPIKIALLNNYPKSIAKNMA